MSSSLQLENFSDNEIFKQENNIHFVDVINEMQQKLMMENENKFKIESIIKEREVRIPLLNKKGIITINEKEDIAENDLENPYIRIQIDISFNENCRENFFKKKLLKSFCKKKH